MEMNDLVAYDDLYGTTVTDRSRRSSGGERSGLEMEG
jgi:hypothetical protein